MDINELKPNSHRSREASADQNSERKIKKVVTSPVKTKKNDGRKLANIFISEDAANVKSYVFMDVLVPAIKKAISDIVTNGIDMILYGEARSSSRRGDSRVSYRSYYDERRDGQYDSSSRSSRSRFDYDDIVFGSRQEAVDVREEMQHAIHRYGVVTVADLYDMVELTAPYTAGNYGWTSVDRADIDHTRDGWIIRLPKAMPIER